MHSKFYILLFLTVLISLSAQAEEWKASWVNHPDEEDYTVLHFRNKIQLQEVPKNLELKISADIRYFLYVNGAYAGQGPANNDLRHYTYDLRDISDKLVIGDNIIAVTVFSLGEHNPIRYESTGAKLIVQANSAGEQINTGAGNWKVYKNEAYTPTLGRKDFQTISYYAMGGGEKIDASLYPWDWKAVDFNDGDWTRPEKVLVGKSYGNTSGYGESSLSLQPPKLPAMDESREVRPVMRSVVGMQDKKLLKAWQDKKPLKIPKNTEVTFLLDQSYLTKGYPFFVFSGGNNAQIEASYAETLFFEDNTQGHRDSIEGKIFKGIKDIYLLDGGDEREFSPLITRVWRYMEVKIKTADEPLTWEAYEASKFIYPFEENASFDSGLPMHKNIWDVSWRTARLCADETYLDCPYYEQLQYVGDTRIQALISLYVSGDDRLMKNSIDQFGNSITDEGITQSRFPSNLIQYIPPYSLFWVNMIHDYHLHRKDDAFTAGYLSKITSVLMWFEKKLRDDGLLGPMPWWSYVDVVRTWPRSSPPGSWKGGSLVLTLQYIYALQDAIALMEYHQKDTLAAYFSDLKDEVQQAVVQYGYNTDKGLFADTPAHNTYSQHANILAILTDTAKPDEHASIFNKIVTDPSVSPTNLYWAFYLNRAAQKSGNGNYFLNNLAPWEGMINKGLSTFAETIQNTRSDCHAWSATPIYEFLNTVCGIQPASAHFESIKIAPNPGALQHVTATMPHPKGEIALDLSFENNGLQGQVAIPEGTNAIIYWKGKEMKLSPGKNTVSL